MSKDQQAGQFFFQYGHLLANMEKGDIVKAFFEYCQQNKFDFNDFDIKIEIGIVNITPRNHFDNSLNRVTLARVDGAFAYYAGSTGSGIYDPGFIEHMKSNPVETTKHITELAKQYLNDQSYSLKDIKELICWASDELGINLEKRK